MIYRINPALPPRFRDRDRAVTELVIEAAIRRVDDRLGLEEMTRLLAAHLIDMSSTSDVLLMVDEHANEFLRRLNRRVPTAPVGSGRRLARDNGGRIARQVMVWAEAAHTIITADDDVTHPLLGLPLSRHARRLWDAAHPTVARFLNAPTYENLDAALAASEIQAVEESGAA